MKLALFSDIHANLQALEACLVYSRQSAWWARAPVSSSARMQPDAPAHGAT